MIDRLDQQIARQKAFRADSLRATPVVAAEDPLERLRQHTANYIATLREQGQRDATEINRLNRGLRVIRAACARSPDHIFAATVTEMIERIFQGERL